MTTFFRSDADLYFPDSDGKPMADNTEQFKWIVLIKENLEILFANDPNVFVAGDLLWYPVKSRIISPVAPDVMVVFGRPKGPRGSYKQWQEDNISPQVVYEILSPSNNLEEMERKLEFYQTYGVEEYYQYDPDRYELKGWLRQGEQLIPIAHIDGWTSPRLGVRFSIDHHELIIYRPDGTPFLTPVELEQKAERERLRAEQAVQKLRDVETLLQKYRDRFGELDS